MTTNNERGEQLRAIRLRAVNEVTRAIARDGIRLSHDEADEMGEQAIDWLRSRLGMRIETTTEGVECRPAGEAKS